MSESKKILYVIAPQAYRDEEFLEPYTLFTGHYHWSVTVASTQTGEAQGMLGHTWMVTETIEGQNVQDYDALVVAGGMGSPDYLWNDSALLSLVKAFNEQQKVVAAICLSGAVLANAGILKGKKATVWPADEALAIFQSAGVLYVQQNVVVDGTIITAPGPEAAKPFAQAIAEKVLVVSPVAG